MDTQEFHKERLETLRTVFVWLFLVIFNLFNLFNSLINSVDSYALDGNISVNINTVLSLTLSDATVNIPVTPSDAGVFSSTSFTATVSTNNFTGYKLLLMDYDTNTNLVHAVTSTATLSTLSAGTTKANFPNNQWGLSLDDTNYLPTPASDGTAITVKENTTPINNDSSTIYAGAKVTNATMSGAYTDVVTISLIANPIPVTFNQAYDQVGKTTVNVGGANYYKMQDMTKYICDLVSSGQQTTLVDTRDDNTYTIFKANDGRCWMSQNLDLNLSNAVTLTNANTDLNSVESWTPESPNGNTITPGNLSSSTWTDDNNNPYSYDPGDVYYYTSGTNNNDIEYTSLANCIADNHTAAECKHYHAGNYYNFSAAIASNDTSAYTVNYTQAPDSICPKGWKLPQGPANANDYADFNDLLVAHEIINNGSADYLPDGFNNIRTTPLFFVRSGYIATGSLNYSGGGNNYHSSTVSASTGSYTFYFDSSQVSIYGAWRAAGVSIRCLTYNNYVYSIEYLPNGTNVINLHNQIVHSGNTSYSLTINSLPPTRTGYVFLGYATSADGDVAYQPGDSVSLTSSSPTITLYAKWATGVTFSQAYSSAGKNTKSVGGVNYYKMQDMTSGICSSVGAGQETSLVDTRDDTIYTVFKANDGKCWMNQNLDLNLSSSTTLTDEDTDLNSVDSWTPESPNGNTIAPGNLSSSTWPGDNYNPYSYDPGDVYYYTSGSTSNDTEYNSLTACMVDHTEAECKHYHAGNYYNFSAAVASNNTYTTIYNTQYSQAPDSICPKGWKLPQGPANANDYSDFNDLLVVHGIINNGATNYLSNGFNNMRVAPLFFVRAGLIGGGSLYYNLGSNGYVRSSSARSTGSNYRLYFYHNLISPQGGTSHELGESIRCVAR